MVSGHKTRIYSVDLYIPIRVTMQVGLILRRVFTAVISYLSEYKEAFALFDKKGTGAVPRETLGDLLRALGQNPTQAEVADIVASAPREGK
jgi:Ca2+-binding EF-hand superfamily protein